MKAKRSCCVCCCASPATMAQLVRAATEADAPTPPSPPDAADAAEPYVNPLERSSRWLLSARAYAIRSAASLGIGLQNLQSPSVPSPSRTVYLDSTLSREWKGKDQIRVDVYLPASASAAPADDRRPAVIDFHGGGFVLGQGTDDARWARAAVDTLDAVVFAVNYRLAPGYPFPTPVEDCADAVLQLARRAAEFGVDPDKILVSGFSAGGNLALASWVLLQDPERWNYKLPGDPPRIAGFVLYYPLLDWTRSRPNKRQGSARPEMTLPKGLTDIFDASYIYPSRSHHQLTDPRLSPGLMPDDLLEGLPPLHLVLCEFDMLLIEGQQFAERLRARNKQVDVRVVKGAKHAWDKPPPLLPKESAAAEYAEAVRAIARWLAEQGWRRGRGASWRAEEGARRDSPEHEKSRVDARVEERDQAASSSSSASLAASSST